MDIAFKPAETVPDCMWNAGEWRERRRDRERLVKET